jgi:hypothetical protein
MNTAYNYVDLTPNGGDEVSRGQSGSGATTSTRIEDSGQSANYSGPEVIFEEIIDSISSKPFVGTYPLYMGPTFRSEDVIAFGTDSRRLPLPPVI